MTMERNNRDYQFDASGGGSFQEHNEHMREFRKSHADVAMVNAPGLDEAALMENMEPLQVSRNMTETGGSWLTNGAMDWPALVPVLKVARYKLSQN